MPTPRPLVLLTLCLAASVVAGCKVDTVEPIVPIASAQADARLYGVWRYRDKGELIYVHIGPEWALGPAKEGQPMRIVMVDHKRNGLTDEVHVAYGARVGKARYLSVMQEYDGKREGYLVVRYSLPEADVVRFATIRGESLAAAIRAGRIKGTVRGEATSEEGTITAEPAAIAAFLAAGGDELFNPPVVLRRVPDR